MIDPRNTLTSDSRCSGVNPTQEHNRFGWGKRLDVADLSDEHPRKHPTHPRQLLNSPIPRIVAQLEMDTPIQFGDLPVVAADQVP